MLSAHPNAGLALTLARAFTRGYHHRLVGWKRLPER
jgi:hypothetical protein